VSTARRWRRTGLGLIATAAAVLGAGLIGTSTAGASAPSHLRIEIVGSGDGFTATPSVPLLVTHGFAPGASASGTMGVRSDGKAPTDLYLRLIDVADDDNGCTAAESAVDHSCGPRQGDLGTELIFRITVATSEHGRYLPVWTGRAAQLEHGIPVAQATAPGHAQWVRLSAALPFASDNRTQTDTFGFGVRVTAQDSSGVEGISIGRGGTAAAPGSGGHSPLGLAFTGTQLGVLAAAGLLLLAGGLVLGVGARSRRRPAPR
jgi:hypothetical protein